MKFRLLVITCLFPLLASCGVEFTYNRLGWIASWYVDDYVSLNEAQEERFKNQFKKWHDWHRKTQLPIYQQHLTAFIKDVNSGLSEAKMESHYDRLEQHWQRLRQYVSPELISMLQTLSDEQKHELFKNMHDKIIEDKEELLDEQQEKSYFARRLEKAEESADEWLHGLNKQQIMRTQHHIKKFKPTGELWIEHRLSWLNQFKKAMLSNTSPLQQQAQLDWLINEPEVWRSKQLQQAVLNNRQVSAKQVSELLNTLSPTQKSYLLDKLAEYQQIFADLHNEI